MTDEAKQCVVALRACDLHKNVQPVAFFVCKDCPGYEPDVPCQINLIAADLIESLSAELEQVKMERDGLSIMLTQARSMLETRTRERDTAIEYISIYKPCEACGLFELQGDNCRKCRKYVSHPCWQWRGVQKG